MLHRVYGCGSWLWPKGQTNTRSGQLDWKFDTTTTGKGRLSSSQLSHTHTHIQTHYNSHHVDSWIFALSFRRTYTHIHTHTHTHTHTLYACARSSFFPLDTINHHTKCFKCFWKSSWICSHACFMFWKQESVSTKHLYSSLSQNVKQIRAHAKASTVR